MGLLNIWNNDEFDTDLLIHIFQKWLDKTHQHMKYRAYGFLEKEGKVTLKDIPYNFLNWRLGRSKYMNNQGDYCACFLNPNNVYDIYTTFVNRDPIGSTYYTIKDLLDFDSK